MKFEASLQLAACLVWSLLSCILPALAGEAVSPSEQAQMLLQQAWYLEHGLRDLTAASKAYEEIVRRFPEQPEVAAQAQLNLVDCLERMGKVPEAKKELVKAYKLFPDELKKYPARMGRLENLRQQFDEGFTADTGLGDSQFVREMLDMIPLSEASKICDTYYQNALQERSQKPQDAIVSLRKARVIGAYLGLTERAADAQTLIGDIYAELGRYPEALVAYNRALADFSDERRLLAWTQVRIAETLRMMGRFEEAVAAYEAVFAKFADQPLPNAWALIWLGDLYRHLGRLPEAHSCWQRASQVPADGPQLQQATQVAAFLLDNEAQPPTATSDPFANDIAYFLAVRYERSGKLTEAQQYYQQCLELSAQKDWPYELARRALSHR